MTLSTAEQLLQDGEGPRAEFKRGAEVDHVLPTVVAFLNTSGGTLLLGVAEDGTVVGLNDASNRAERLQAALAERIRPRALWTLTVERVHGRDLVAIEVPAGTAPPYAVGGRVLVRRGFGNVTATPEDLRRLLGTADEDERWERRPALRCEARDLDAREIEKTVLLAERRGQPLGSTQESLSPVLNALNVADEGRLLNSAAVLFAANPARMLPQTRVRLAVFRDDDQREFIDNRVLEGHAFALLDGIMAFFDHHLPVASTLASGTVERADQPLYPRSALREAVMNALTHRDYAAYDGTLSVALYPRRLELWNPGRLPEGLQVSDLKRGAVSRPHNPDIAHVFFLRGLIERWGTGTRRIAEECRAARLPEPEWEEVGGGIRLTLRLPTPRDALETVGDRGQRLLRSMAPGQTIDVDTYHRDYAAEVSERSARRDLDGLVAAGFLRVRGRGRKLMFERTDKVT